MSYTLLLLRVPPGASEDDVERIARETTEAEDTRAPAPPDPERERFKRALVDALLADCPELKGGGWTVTGPEEGAGIEITFYDDYVSLDMPSAAGTKQDWIDVYRYLGILAGKGGFVVWDPQGSDLVDPAAGPSGDGRRVEPSEAASDDDPDVEREDVRRGGEIAKLINRIVDDAIAAPLAAAGFKRSGRTWRRTLDNGLTHVVNVRWGPRNEGVEGEFGLSAGVYSRELAESIALYKPTSSPKEPDCQVRLRPGPGGRSSWRVRVPGIAKPDPDLPGVFGRFFGWLDRRADDKAGDQHVKATRELRDVLEHHAFPAFERMTTVRGLRDELARRPDLFWAAHASLLLGERDEAKRLLELALKKASGNPAFSETVREWGRRQGLL